jgi:hypothetical protein
MGYKMNGFSGFKSSPTKFKMGKGYDKPVSTKKRAQIGKANKFLGKIGAKDMQMTQADLKKPFSKGLDMTLNDNLNKAVRKSEAKEFLRKNTIKPKVKKPLSRPFGPGTRPLARNVSKVLRTASRGFGALGLAMGLYEGTKAVFKGYGKMGKTKQVKQIIKSGRMQPGKI